MKLVLRYAKQETLTVPSFVFDYDIPCHMIPQKNIPRLKRSGGTGKFHASKTPQNLYFLEYLEFIKNGLTCYSSLP